MPTAPSSTTPYSLGILIYQATGRAGTSEVAKPTRTGNWNDAEPR